MSAVKWEQRYKGFSPYLCEFCGRVVSRQLEMLLDKDLGISYLYREEDSRRAPSSTEVCVLCNYALSMLQGKITKFTEEEVLNTYTTRAICFPYDP